MRWADQITLIALTEKTPRTNEHGFPADGDETATTVFADKNPWDIRSFIKRNRRDIPRK